MQNPTSADIQRVREFLLGLQARICSSLEQQEQLGGGTAEFVIDDWERPEGGGGRSRVLQNGEVIEKGGVMFSHINISKLPASAFKSSAALDCSFPRSTAHREGSLKL